METRGCWLQLTSHITRNINLLFHLKTYRQFNYHREHFLLGFIAEPSGHWKALLKSSEFPRVAATLSLEGGWGLVTILLTSYCSLLSLHHTWP